MLSFSWSTFLTLYAMATSSLWSSSSSSLASSAFLTTWRSCLVTNFCCCLFSAAIFVSFNSAVFEKVSESPGKCKSFQKSSRKLDINPILLKQGSTFTFPNPQSISTTGTWFQIGRNSLVTLIRFLVVPTMFLAAQMKEELRSSCVGLSITSTCFTRSLVSLSSWYST